MRNTKEIKKDILQLFRDDEELFDSAIEDLDRWNGYLGGDRYYLMEELDDLYCGVDHSEVLMRAFYGHDAETWHTDSHGEKEYGAFNPNRYYFRFNGYGNLVSADYRDYSAFLDDYFVDSVIENRGRLYTDSDELNELLDEYEEAERAEEE